VQEAIMVSTNSPARAVDTATTTSLIAKPAIIQLTGVVKTYRSGKLEYPALQGIDLTIDRGEMVSIIGPSGSGKSTILNMVTGIDRPSAGQVVVDGRQVDTMSEDELAAWRGRHVGIVFQFFQLLPTLTALENAVLPLDFARLGSDRERVARATRNLELVGLGDKRDHLPSELSGGEQQRVAIARALACEPALLVGDEPTGNLDTETAARMLDLLVSLNEGGMTVIFVTHDAGLAARAGRTIAIRDGRIESDG
jgi:putative ABC transport system ATP-binding protein